MLFSMNLVWTKRRLRPSRIVKIVSLSADKFHPISSHIRDRSGTETFYARCWNDPFWQLCWSEPEHQQHNIALVAEFDWIRFYVTKVTSAVFCQMVLWPRNSNTIFEGKIRWCLTLCTTILNELYTSLVLLLTNTCSNYYTYFISYILNISKIVLRTNVQCYKVSSDSNEALKYLSLCQREAVKGFSQLCIESLILKSSKAVHIYHLGDITNISLPLSKYHFSSL